LKQSPQALISASTLLPLARYVRFKVLALEEHTHDTKTEPKSGDPGDIISATTTTHQYSPDNALECLGRGPAGATGKTSGSSDSTSPEITDDLEKGRQ
jgi:hypothetical protein